LRAPGNTNCLTPCLFRLIITMQAALCSNRWSGRGAHEGHGRH
jgi:hypothetical protein